MKYGFLAELNIFTQVSVIDEELENVEPAQTISSIGQVPSA